jgi:hypothetical protein
MNLRHIATLLPRFVAGLGALVAAGLLSANPTAAGNFATVEPEVGSAAALPGMPPPPDVPAATQLAPAAVAPWSRSPAEPLSPIRHGQATASPHSAPARTNLPAPPRSTAAMTAPSPAVTPAQSRAAAAQAAQSAATTAHQSAAVMPLQSAAATAPQSPAIMPGQSPLAVVRWALSATLQHEPNGGLAIVATAGRPLYLWFTIEGGQAAIDRLRAAGRLAIEVHWTRDGASAGAGSGAPDLTTELTMDRPGLVSTLAGQVQKQGHFEWHLWARKDALSRGRWTVSLTYPDGQPVQCGQAVPQPCRLLIDVG